MDISAEAVAAFARRAFNFTDSGSLFGLVRMMNESVEGEADGQRWGNRQPVSPAIAAVLAWFEHCCAGGACSTHASAVIALQFYTLEV